MFPIGGFLVLCGLLAPTSALPLLLPLPLNQDQPLLGTPGLPLPGAPGLPLPGVQGLPLPGAPGLPLPGVQGLPLPGVPGLPSNPTDIAGNLIGALTDGLLSGGLLESLKSLPVLDILKNKGGSSDNLLGGLLGKVTSVLPLLNNIIDLKVGDAHLLELSLKQTPDGHRLGVTIPLDLTFDIDSPLIGSLLKLSVKFNVTAEVTAVKDNQDKQHLAVSRCVYSPDSVEVSILNGTAILPDPGLLDDITGLFSRLIPDIVEAVVCPLLGSIFGKLDITLAHDVIDLLIHGIDINVKV